MDRKIVAPKHAGIQLFKKFEYLDLFPYTVALLMLGGSFYVLNAAVAIAHAMKHY